MSANLTDVRLSPPDLSGDASLAQVGPRATGELDGTALARHERACPRAPWTYLVNDQFLGNNVLRDLSHRPGVAAWAVITLGPLVFLWGGGRERWIRRRKRAARDTP